MKKRADIWLTACTAVLVGLVAVAREPVSALVCAFPRGAQEAVALSLAPGAGAREIQAPFGTAMQFNGTADAALKATPEAFAKWRQALCPGEVSAGFFIRFDKPAAPAGDAAASNFGLFDCVLGTDGRLVLSLFSEPTDLLGPEYTMRSRDTYGVGEWLHVEFSFSARRRRAALYVNGVFQHENDDPDLLAYAAHPVQIGYKFSGAVGDFRFYDAVLDSEQLTIASDKETPYQTAQAELGRVIEMSRNTALLAWTAALGNKLDGLKRDPLAKTSAWKGVLRDIANAAVIAERSRTAKPGIVGKPVTAFTVPPISQEMRMTYALPEDGVLTGELQVFAAQGEYESASFVVIPFAPVKAFEIKLSDLAGPGGRIPASAVDAKLVKRWFRAGGAWLNYHSDRNTRLLTPDMLVNDDKLIEVDEIRQTNKARLSYPDGDVYFDISDNLRRYETNPRFDVENLPFKDADTLQPVELPEAGRSQQYWLTVHVPEDAAGGVYRGTVSLVADGKPAGELALTLRVFPFQLPEAHTYYDLDRVFYGNFSFHLGGQQGTNEKRMRAELEMMKAHNMLYPSGPLMNSDENFDMQVRLRRELGFPNKPLFAGSSVCSPWVKLKAAERTTESYLKVIGDFERTTGAFLDRMEKAFGHRDVYMYGIDEAGGYGALIYAQEPSWLAVKRLGAKIRTTGMSAANLKFVSDTQDMLVKASDVLKTEAEHWHAAGGLIMNYARPFPSTENPLTMRRRIGMGMYLSHYDGIMIHGFVASPDRVNEFFNNGANYRHFSVAYPQVDGVIGTLALEGVREAFDDIRYATLMKRLATEAMNSGREDLVREGKRQLVWLSQMPAYDGDLDYLRLAFAHRIMILQDLSEKHGVK